MNSFYTKRNKLKFLFQQNQNQSQDLNNQKIIQRNLNTEISQDNTPNNLFSKLNDLSLDWEVLDRFESYIGSLDDQYKIWEIEWNKFDIRLLPYLDIKILYRIIGGDIKDEEIISPRISKNFEIDDIVEETSKWYKKVKMVASLYINKYSSSTIYEAKLNVLFINPRKYI